MLVNTVMKCVVGLPYASIAHVPNVMLSYPHFFINLACSDLAELYGSEIRVWLVAPWVEALLAKGRRSKEPMTKKMATWATENLKALR